MASSGSGKRRSQISKVEVCYLWSGRLNHEQTKDAARLHEGEHRQDVPIRVDTPSPRLLDVT